MILIIFLKIIKLDLNEVESNIFLNGRAEIDMDFNESEKGGKFNTN